MTTAYELVQHQLLNQQKTWLITGVAGFIGSNLLETLLNLNQRVIGIDNFSTGFQHNIDNVLESVDSKYKNNFSFYPGDICQLSDCQHVTKNVDYILHQAALGSVPRSIKNPENTHASNATGFLNVLVAAKDNHVKRVVYASSSSVYGDSPHLPKQEDQIGNPLSPYAVSKLTNELYANVFSRCYQMEIIGLRYFNVFGPRQNVHGPYAAVIPCWIQALLKNEPVYINGDGETTRDFCYIANAIQANILAAVTNDSRAVNTVYNIAANEQNTLNKLYYFIAESLKLNAQPIYRDFRAGDIRHSLADIQRAQSLLGYHPARNFYDNLKSTVDWYCANFRVQNNISSHLPILHAFDH